eukprot:6437566-Pyramimonas_sp.AAC.1
MYDAAESFEKTTVLNGAYEDLGDYVVKPGSLLFCSSEQQNVAGDMPADEHRGVQAREWDGIAWVFIHDNNEWEKVLLPSADSMSEGQHLTINILKRSVLAKINMRLTKEPMQTMRVYYNDSGLPAGLPLKGTDEAVAHYWYTVVLSPEAPLLVMTNGGEMPSPDSTNDEVAGWEDVKPQA